MDGVASAEIIRPTALDEALSARANGAVPAAGCTDLFPLQTGQVLRPPGGGAILDLSGLDALRLIEQSTEGLRIGAGVTWSALAHAALPPACRALQQAGAGVGSIQIQNAATIGGNLCTASPAADGVPPLLGLDASVELLSLAGRRVMPLARFLLGPRRTDLRPGEILTAILIPAHALTGRSVFRKLGAREYLVISITMVSARLTERGGLVTGAALAIGAASPVACRLDTVEAALTGKPFARGLADLIDAGDVAAALAPIDDIRATASYRAHAAAVLLRRAVAELVSEGFEGLEQ